MKNISESQKNKKNKDDKNEEVLQELIVRMADQEKRIAQLEEILSKKDARIAELEALVKWYETQFRVMKRRQFGASSEITGSDFRECSPKDR